jgi:hypothetical protein
MSVRPKFACPTPIGSLLAEQLQHTFHDTVSPSDVEKVPARQLAHLFGDAIAPQLCGRPSEIADVFETLAGRAASALGHHEYADFPVLAHSFATAGNCMTCKNSGGVQEFMSHEGNPRHYRIRDKCVQITMTPEGPLLSPRRSDDRLAVRAAMHAEPV